MIHIPFRFAGRFSCLFALALALSLAPARSANQFIQVWSAKQAVPTSVSGGSAAMATDAQGNVFVTEATSVTLTSHAGFNTVKYAAADGHVLWSQRYDSTGTEAVPSVLALDSGGNAVVAGTTNDLVNGAPNQNTNLHLIKYASNGEILWQSTVTSAANNYAESVNAIALDAHGNVVLTGGITVTGGIQNLLTVKCEANSGAVLWKRLYASPWKGDSAGRAIAVDGAGNVLVTGTSGRAASGTGMAAVAASTDFYLAKLSGTNGALMWSKSVTDGIGLAVAADAAGNVTAAGRINLSGKNVLESAYTARYSAAGALGWKQTYAGSFGAGVNGLALAPDGSVVVAGFSATGAIGSGANSTTPTVVYTAKYANADGKVQWSDVSTSVGVGEAVLLDQTGDVVVLGSLSSSVVGPHFDVIRYAVSTGVLNLEKQFGDSSDGVEYVNPLGLLPGGGVAILGLSSTGTTTSVNYAYVVLDCQTSPTAGAVTGAGAGVAGSVTSEKLSGAVTPSGTAATAWFAYGPAADDYLALTPVQSAGSGTSPVQLAATISGLKPHTTYHFRMVSEESGILTFGADETFTTGDSPPVAADDLVTGRNGALTLTVNVLANDHDPDGDPLTVAPSFAAAPGAKKLPPAHGTVTTDGTSVFYTPNATFTGTDAFTYTVSDGFGGLATATVHIALTESSTVPMVIEGDEVAGEAVPATYSAFGVPSINDAGELAFQASILTAVGTVKTGVFSGATPKAVAHSGDAAPKIGGAKFASFRDPALNSQGGVAFIGTLSGVPSATSSGIWFNGSAGGTLEEVARQGMTAPGASGAVFGTFLSMVLPENGGLAFTAALRNGVQGVWFWPSAGSLRLVLRQGSTVTVDGAAREVGALAVFGSLSGSPGQRRGYDAAGDLLVRAGFTDGTEALVLARVDGTLTVVSSTHEAIPALSGAKLANYDPGCLADSGAASFLARLGPGGAVNAANDAAILTGARSGSFGVIARSGSPIPGLAPSRYQSLLDPVADRGGAIAFLGTINAGGDSKGPYATGLWTSAGGGSAPALLAKTGSVPPGAPGAVFTAFKSLALPGSRGPAFVASMAASGGGGSQTGLWARDRNGAVHLLARTGVAIEVGGIPRTPNAIAVLGAAPASPSQGQGYSENGGFVIRVFFEDGGQALLAAWVP